MDGDLLLLHLSFQRLRNLVVLGGHEARQHLDQGDFGAERCEETGELGADNPSTQHHEPTRLPWQFERLLAGDHLGAVQADARRHAGAGAGGEDHVVEGQFLRAAAGEGHPQAPGPRQGCRAAENLDLAAGEQGFDPARHLGHDLALAFEQPLPLDLRFRNFDPELARPADLFEQVGGDDPGLGRNASPIETGATELVFFDDRDGQSELRRANRGDVAAGTGADNDDLDVTGITHGNPFRGRAPRDVGFEALATGG